MKSSHGRWVPPARLAVAAVLVLAAVATVGFVSANPNRAGAAGSTYVLKTVKLASGAGTIARWNPCQKAIVWRDNLSGLAAAKRPAMLAQFKRGFAQLSQATGLTYRYAGKTLFIPRQENLVQQPADIVVAVINPSKTNLSFSERSLGFGGVLWATWYGSGGEGAAVMRGYVVLVPSGIAKLKAGFGKGKTQGNVVLHELGHASGLEHATSRASQMYPTLTTASPNGYAPGDRTGLAKVGVKAGCITVPARVNITDYS